MKPITLAIITKAIRNMASGKVAVPSSTVSEKLKHNGEAGLAEVRDPIEDIISSSQRGVTQMTGRGASLSICIKGKRTTTVS